MLTRALASALWHHIGPMFSPIDAARKPPPHEPEHSAPDEADADTGLQEEHVYEWDAIVQDLLSRTDAFKVKLFDRSGVTVYSTVREEIGTRQPMIAPLTTALSGGVFSEVASDAGSGNVQADTHVLVETYVPVRQEGGGVVGVMEVYLDVSARFASARTEATQHAAMLVAVLTTLYAALYLVIRHADHRLRQYDGEREQHLLAIEAARAGLEQRVEERTTDLKRANTSLRESEEKFRSIAVSAKDAIIMMDDTGRITYWNDAAQRIFDYGADEVMGKSLHELLSSENYRGCFERNLARFAADGKGAIIDHTVEFTALRRGGEEFPVELSVSAVQIEGTWHAVGLVRDITERQRAHARMNRDVDIHSAVSTAQKLALQSQPLTQKLERILELVLSLPWLGFQSRGAIFVLGASGDELDMVAQKGLPSELCQTCRTVKVGECLCGRAALYRELVFVDRVDARHVRRNPVMGSHGHYCVPLVAGGERLLGVLTCYVDQGHERNADEESFLRVIADTLAGVIERHRADEQVRQLSRAVEQGPASIMITQIDGTIVYVNPKFTRVTGYAPDELIGRNPRMLQSGQTSEQTYRELWSTINAGQVWRGEIVNRKKNGEFYWEWQVIAPVKDERAEITHFIAIKEDITKRKHDDETMRNNQALLRSVVDNTDNALIVLDEKKAAIFYNQRYATLWKLPRELLDGRPTLETVLRAQCANGTHNSQDIDRLLLDYDDQLRNADPSKIMTLSRSDGVVIESYAVELGGVGHLMLYRDITQQRNYENQLLHLATHDALTDLPNHNLFQDRMQQAVIYAARHECRAGVLFIDLDHFKLVNDNFGHNVGDTVLKIIGQRIATVLRAGDTVARHGGDEFAAVICEVRERLDVNRIVHKIINAVQEPIELGDERLEITCSIGVSTYPDDGEDAESLVRCADIAMYRAKELGRNSFVFYAEEMEVGPPENMSLRRDLRRVLEREELVLYYQPQVDLGTGEISGAEALVRWQHPELGLVPPDRFIPLAEESAIIGHIGEWVLHTACAQIRAWLDEGLGARRVSVNVSPRQFRQQDIASLVADALKRWELDASSLDLELTESVILESPEKAINTFNAIKAVGVGLSIDDFGTGYSNLAHLKRFPIDRVKIDRTFVKDIPSDSDDAVIARTIISMAHLLGCKVVAEGVETLPQLSFLRLHHCDEVQGYYFSRPIPAAEFTDLLRQGGRLDLTESRALILCD